MSTILNKLDCIDAAKNTGVGECPFDMSTIIKHIKVPRDKAFTANEIAVIQTTLETAILADKVDRIYPFPNWEEITDNSEALQVNTFGYGGKSFGRQGKYDVTFTFIDGALCKSKAMKSHRGKGSYLMIDNNFRIIGTKVGDTMKGIPMLMEVIKPKFADGTNATKYEARFIFDSSFVWDDIAFIEKVSGFNPTLLDGLQDIILKVATGSTTTAVALTATTGCDVSDLGVLFPTESVVAANWTGVAVSDGATVVPTAVAYVTGVGGAPGIFTLTFAAAVSSVTMVSASALDTAGISGFEATVLSPVV